MNHETLKEKLFDLYDGALTGAERLEVEVHLEGCAECRGAYGRWERVAKAFFQAPAVAESEAFVQRLMRRLKKEAVEEREPAATWLNGIRWLIPALALASLSLIFLGSVQNPLSVEALLLGEEQEIASGAAPTMDQMFEFIMEEPS